MMIKYRQWIVWIIKLSKPSECRPVPFPPTFGENQASMRQGVVLKQKNRLISVDNYVGQLGMRVGGAGDCREFLTDGDKAPHREEDLYRCERNGDRTVGG